MQFILKRSSLRQGREYSQRLLLRTDIPVIHSVRLQVDWEDKPFFFLFGMRRIPSPSYGITHILSEFPAFSVRACSVTESCATLCDSVDHSLPGSSVHRNFRARILGCHFLFQEIFPPQGLPLISCIGRRVLYHWAAWGAFSFSTSLIFLSLFFLSLPGVSTYLPSLSCDTCSSSYLSHLSFRAFAQAGVPSSSAARRGRKAVSSCEPWLGSHPCLACSQVST